MPLMNQSQYAKHRGVTKQTINRYFSRGYIDSSLVYLKGKKKALIDSAKADAILDQYLDPAFVNRLKPVMKLSAKDGSFLEARAEAQVYQARLLKQKLEEKQNKYVLRSDVQKEVSQVIEISRKVLSTIPVRVAAAVQPRTKNDQIEIEKILSEEIKPILEDFFKQLNNI
jgi:hypothetical protein